MCALKTIQALCRAGAEAHAAGDIMNADFLLHQAYSQAKGLQSPVLEAKILNTMGVFKMEGKQAKAAISLLTTARDKVEARIGKSNKLYTVISNNLLQAEVATIMETAAVR
jgi:hypothetical protein